MKINEEHKKGLQVKIDFLLIASGGMLLNISIAERSNVNYRH